MAIHYTNISGTGYKVKGGKANISGTGYNIKYGVANIGGSGYNIKFANDGDYAMLYSDGNMIFQANDEVKAGKTLTASWPDYLSHDYDGSNTSTAPWSGSIGSVKQVSFDTPVAPTDIDRWFCEARNLTSFNAINLNLNAITSMHGAFDNSINWTGPALTTPNADNMTAAYFNCTNLTGSPYCSPKATLFRSAYGQCSKITGSPVCGANVVNFHGAYRECRSLTGTPVCGANVVNFSETYWNCRGLTGAPVCGANVYHMVSSYGYCTNIKGPPACGAKVANMSQAYYQCWKLTGSPVCGANVVNFHQAYAGCGSLTGSPVCGAKVTDMNHTYRDCLAMKGFPVVGAKVTRAQYAYYNCQNLNRVAYFLGNSVSNVNNCFGLKNNSNHLIIFTLAGGTTNTTLHTATAASVVGAAITWTNAGPYQYNSTYNIFIVPSTSVVNVCDSATLHTSGVLHFHEGNTPVNTKVINYYNDFYRGTGYDVTDMPPWSGDRNNITNIVFSKPFKPLNAYYLFDNCYNLVNLSTTNLNLSCATDLTYAFWNCRKLATTPYAIIQTAQNATNMFSTFQHCVNLTGDGYCPANVTNMTHAFSNCQSLNGSTHFGSKVLNAQYAYDNCRKLNRMTTVPDSVTNIAYACRNCINIKGSFNIGNKVTNMAYAFNNCTSLYGNINIGTGVTNMYCAFNNCTKFSGSIYLHSNVVLNTYNCFGNKPSTRRLNIYMRNNSTMLSKLRANNTYNRNITWTSFTQGAYTLYQNTTYNIYIYYNYLSS